MPTAEANPALETARLTLRPARLGDADGLFALYSDPRVVRYWAWPAWTSIEQAHDYITRMAPKPDSLPLVAARRVEGDVVGTVSLYQINAQNRRAELGYALRQALWGQGYASEMVGAVLAHAFDALGLHRIEADIDPRNDASARLLERMGFLREGYLRERWIVNGEVQDTALYGLLVQDWRARQA